MPAGKWLPAADRYYIRRLVKTLLWMKGGYKVYCDDEEIFRYLHDVAFCDGGEQDFDFHYFTNIFEQPFEVLFVKEVPKAKDSPIPMGGHLEGCRIGFDAGGSDRKVSAVIDGETVYSEEVVWFPKVNSDPDYHYDGIVSALKSAAKHMPRVDAVGAVFPVVFPIMSYWLSAKRHRLIKGLYCRFPCENFTFCDADTENLPARAPSTTPLMESISLTVLSHP